MNKADADRTFARLAALGIAVIEGDYSGSGDSGQFDGFTAYDSQRNSLAELNLDKPIGEEEALGKVTARLRDQPFRSFSSELEDLVWSAIDDAGHDGWENNDGGYGKLIIDVRERTIVLEHSIYMSETKDSTHEIFNENADVMHNDNDEAPQGDDLVQSVVDMNAAFSTPAP